MVHDLGYCVSNDYAERHHAAEGTAKGQYRDSSAIEMQQHTKAIAPMR
jgi:hypothetical protein